MFTATANVTGPMFDSRGVQVVEDYTAAVELAVADDAAQRWRAGLRGRVRSGTGYYVDHITVDLTTGDPAVTDGGVVYGPWLEGVGDRNASTGWPGYGQRRQAAQQSEARAVDIGERQWPRFAARLE
ncbi:hypothetical protein [Actinokineospora sp. UTMC 2448]|uniref:hypothetical protein n=1 Tax=Actinokineospora sp. UTMC 2448 TaxID=2268449 RepID=UPI0021645694|nr:hypothetical protein [Actinokineospora sp. UTMC 2448]UVS81843.1 hypothetical protein Actkin_05607 [Actinokineospora sp. UTMC 2448]